MNGCPAVAASSFFPGDVEGWLSKSVASELGFKLPLWSPAAARPQATDMLIGDGGLSENTNLCALLRRGVAKIVLVQSTSTPLNPHWNATARRPLTKDVDDELAAYFGVFLNADDHVPAPLNKPLSLATYFTVS